MRRRISVQKRISRFILLISCAMIIVCGRIAWVQMVNGNDLEERVRLQVGENRLLQSPRGTIYDRNGRELAVSILTKSLFVDPSQVKDADQLASDLAPIIDMTEEQIKDRIAIGGGFVWLKRRMEPEAVEAVRKLINDRELNCLNFESESKRYYPNDMLAANVLGFVGTDDIGLDGIEHSCDDIIKSKSMRRFVMTDRNNKPILGSVLDANDFEKCNNVYLTIDSTIQFILEQNLDLAMQENKPHAVTAIVMDPKTGDVLAMANRPSYNPNEFSKYSNASFKNLGVSMVYEPGSTFKSVVAAAALQEGTVTPDKVFQDPGYVMVSGRKILNWDNESHGTVTFTDIIKSSLNTGFVQVGLQLGAEKLNDHVRQFGFGKPTDIHLPGEESGILFKAADMRDSDLATMSIGQSIAVTPIQLVTAMSAIANDGVLLKPHIIKQVSNYNSSFNKTTEPEEVRRVISSDVDKQLKGLLEQVVASGGGGKAKVKGYRIAGKTGTAQKLREDGTGYMDGHYIASFCGFAPVDDPRITVLVIIDDPSNVYYGGQIAAPIAGRIFEEVLRYLNVKPIADNLDLKELNLPVNRPKMASKPLDKVPQGKILVPDVIGRSLREAAQEMAASGLTMIPEGNGTAYQQSIIGNTLVDNGTEIKVYFKQE